MKTLAVIGVILCLFMAFAPNRGRWTSVPGILFWNAKLHLPDPLAILVMVLFIVLFFAV